MACKGCTGIQIMNSSRSMDLVDVPLVAIKISDLQAVGGVKYTAFKLLQLFFMNTFDKLWDLFEHKLY